MKTVDTALNRNFDSPLSVLCQSSPWVRDLALATLFGALTALSAQIRIHIPGNPVPFTGQVFMVLLAGGLLGARWGAISQLEYLALGLAGFPVFSGGVSGPLAFSGPTGGYLVGFVVAAWVVGTMARSGRGFIRMFAANLCGVCIIHLLGWWWLAGWMGLVKHTANPATAAFVVGVLPFLPVDGVKAALAARISLGASRHAGRI